MANKSNKTAICPYSVTKDIKDISTDIPVAGQRIYVVDQGWCTGDGVTELRNLTPSTITEDGEVDLSNYYTKTEVDNKIDEINTSEVDLSNYYTKTESDDMLNSVFQGMDMRDEVNLGLAKEYTNNSITEATNQLEPFFASITTNKDDLYVNCGYHGINNAYNMNRCIYLKHNSKIYHLAALVNSEFIFFDYEGSTIIVGMDTDAYDYVIVNEQTGFESAKAYIDSKIDEIDIPEVDLSNYYTKTEVDDKISAVDGAGTIETDAIILRSSTAGSTKKFVITIDDNGTLKATELVEEVNE